MNTEIDRLNEEKKNNDKEKSSEEKVYKLCTDNMIYAEAYRNILSGNTETAVLLLTKLKSENFLPSYMLLAFLKNGRFGHSTEPLEEDIIEFLITNRLKYQKKSETGNAEYQFFMSGFYEFGIGVEKNTKNHYDLCLASANQGFPLAQNSLGVIYSYGSPETEKNLQTSTDWFLKAANQEFSHAQFNLGITYEIMNKINEAFYWYEKAAKNGHKKGQYQTGFLLFQGKNIPKSYEMAYYWLKKAADRCHLQADLLLVDLFIHGLGSLEEKAITFSRLFKAAEEGDQDAQKNIGHCFLKGIGVEKNLYFSKKWYRKADQGQIGNRVYLVKGIDDGRKAWYYTLVDIDKLPEFVKALTDDIIHLENYGEVLYSAFGEEPPEELTEELKNTYINNDDRERIQNILNSPSSFEIEQFLKIIVAGKQTEVENLLKSNAKLAIYSGNIKDHSGREFIDITGFQYAVWALDSNMWMMIQRYLSEEELLFQIEGFLKGAWVKDHNEYADFENCISKMKNFNNNLKKWSSEKINEYWISEVGKAQMLLPMHVLQEYSQNNGNFYPNPKFDLELDRKLPDWLETGINNGSLGTKWAIAKGKSQRLGVKIGLNWCLRKCYSRNKVEHDINALTELFKIRKIQRSKLLINFE